MSRRSKKQQKGTAASEPADPEMVRDEPRLTQQNAQTIREEIDLSEDSETPPRDGAIPSSYGAPGGTIRGDVDERFPDETQGQ